MNKKVYLIPEIEIIKADEASVISVSNDNEIDLSGGGSGFF